MNKQADVEFHMLQDPSLTDGLYYGERHDNPNKPNHGKAQVAINMRELIGGYCRYKDRSPAQTMAAAKFKSIVEASQIANLKAVDLESPLVDTSLTPTSIDMEHGEWARARHREVLDALGLAKVGLLYQVIIADVSQRKLAKQYKLGKGGNSQIKVARLVHAAVDDLAHHFNL